MSFRDYTRNIYKDFAPRTQWLRDRLIRSDIYMRQDANSMIKTHGITWNRSTVTCVPTGFESKMRKLSVAYARVDV